jgi:hypothetical protein
MSTQPTKFPAALASTEFDFDAWASLAASDPAAFERSKRDLLMQAVGEAPESQRAQLTGLVEQLTAPPVGNPTGLERAVAAHNVMMQGMHSLQNQLQTLKTELGEAPEAAQVEASLAQFTTLTIVKR